MLFYMVLGAEPPTEKREQGTIDEALFTQIGEGSKDAFETLYCLTERTIYAFALSIVRNPHDASDIVQDTFLKIRASAHLYKPMGKPLAWMFTIARNIAHNMIRVNGKSVSSEELGMENHADYAYVEDPTDRLVLTAALRCLEESERQIILLHAVSGLKHREIAEDIGIPLATVLSRYHRGLKKLKKNLAEGGSRNEK